MSSVEKRLASVMQSQRRSMDLSTVELAQMVDVGIITKERLCELLLGGAGDTESLQSQAGAKRSRTDGGRD